MQDNVGDNNIHPLLLWYLLALAFHQFHYDPLLQQTDVSCSIGHVDWVHGIVVHHFLNSVGEILGVVGRYLKQAMCYHPVVSKVVWKSSNLPCLTEGSYILRL